MTAAAGGGRPRRRARRRLWFAAVAGALGLVVALVLTEVALRVFDPIGLNYTREFTKYKDEATVQLWAKPPEQITDADLDGFLFHHRPDLEMDLGSFTLRTNSMGFRGPEIAPEKPADTFRVVVLGDSVAFGWGVDVELTFVRRFEAVLAERLGRPVEVVNTAHLVYDSMQQFAMLRDRAMALDPDLVLLVYVTNDIEPTRDLIAMGYLPPGHPLHLQPPAPMPAVETLWSRLQGALDAVGLSATATLVSLQSPADARKLAALPAGTRYVPEQFGDGPRGWARSQRALLGIRDLCRGHGVPFVVLDHSFPALEALPGFCREHDIPWFDLRFTPAERELPIYNSLLDTHANARGQDLLLAKLRALLDDLPLPR